MKFKFLFLAFQVVWSLLKNLKFRKSCSLLLAKFSETSSLHNFDRARLRVRKTFSVKVLMIKDSNGMGMEMPRLDLFEFNSKKTLNLK
jgi:hypothetical protein